MVHLIVTGAGFTEEDAMGQALKKAEADLA